MIDNRQPAPDTAGVSRPSLKPLAWILRIGVALALVILVACHNEIDFHQDEAGEPSCQILNGNIDFGTVVADGTSFADRTFSLRNIGGGQLSGTIRADAPGVTILSGGGFYSLGPGQLRRVTVRFQAPAVGDFTGQISVGHTCRAVLFEAHAESPQGCQVSPVDLDFGTVLTDGSFVDKTFTITNPGPGILAGNINETCDAFTLVSGGGNYSLNPSQSRTVTVRFQPATAGDQQCLIETGPDICADVTARGFAENPPVCLVDPPRVVLPQINVGTSTEGSFTITNTGGSQLTGSVTEGCSAFSIVSGGGFYSLGSGASRTVTVRFSPTTGGADSCEIQLGSQCANPVVVGSGGIPPECSLSPGSLSFGDVVVNEFVDRSFTITNTGGQTLSGSVTEACAEFSILSGGGAFSLGPGISQSVTVRLTPTSTGAKSCTIDTGTSDCSDVGASGNGVLAPACSLSTTALDFGTVIADGSFVDRTFTITNSGGGFLEGTLAEDCNHYVIISGGGFFSLGALQSKQVTVRFQPTAFGTFTCTITTGNSCSVSATGVGAVGFAAHVRPLISTSCAVSGCHDGVSGLPDFRVYATASSPTYVSIPAETSLLLLKPANLPNPDGLHGGGLIPGWNEGSANYNTVLQWIQQGLLP
jgi:hypothetical protein